MKYLSLLALLASFFASPSPSPGASATDATAANGRVHGIGERLLAPCCWREAVTVHRSPKATEVQTEIAAMVRSGASDQQVVDAMAARYGKRILRIPDGPERQWLFVAPLAAFAAGLLGVGFVIRRWATGPRAVPAVAGDPYLQQAAYIPDDE